MRHIPIRLLDTRMQAYLPAYGTQGAAGLDLRACLEEPLAILPDECVLIPTGIALHIQDPSLCGLIFPRSGLGHKHGIILGNGVGVIDSDYQGEIKVSLWNRSKNPFRLEPFDRIAQLLLMPIEKITFSIVESFSPTERGSAGFGSTGVQ